MKKCALLIAIICMVVSSASSSWAVEIAVSTRAGWFSQAAADRETQEIVDAVTAVPVSVFTSADHDALAEWVVANTGDGDSDCLILCGVLPATIYPGSNAQPDGSLVELFLDDGNTIINTGDWTFYVASAGGNNGTAGLPTIMDIPSMDMWDDNLAVTVTAEGQTFTPSLVDFQTDRAMHFDQLANGWIPELTLAIAADGNRAEPSIVRNTATNGRIGMFFQTASQDNDPRGEVISEWLNNYFIPVATTPHAWAPTPANSATGVTDVVATWQEPDVENPVYTVLAGTDPAALEVLAEGITEPTLAYGSVPDVLDVATTYYWRVDVNGEEGFLWSFTTTDGKPVIDSMQAAYGPPGSDVQLVCNAVSPAGAELSYQWYRDEVNMMGVVLTDVPLPGATAAVLDVVDIKTTDEGGYYCIVANEYGETVSSIVQLDVQVGLIHRWTMDESPDGVTLPDIVGGADATLVNNSALATIADGQVTLANPGHINSNDMTNGNYIDLPNGIFSELTQMTIIVWTTSTGNTSAWQRVFDIGTSNGGEDISDSGGSTSWFMIALDGANNVWFEHRNLGASVVCPINDNGPLPANEEVLITIVQDDVAGTAKLYINGGIVAGYKPNVTLKELVDNNNWLGRSMFGGDAMYDGSYNEVRIYDTAVSAADIAAAYLAGPEALPEPTTPCDVHVIGDRNNDCVVDFVDLAITADEFLTQSLEEEDE